MASIMSASGFKVLQLQSAKPTASVISSWGSVMKDEDDWIMHTLLDLFASW